MGTFIKTLFTNINRDEFIIEIDKLGYFGDPLNIEGSARLVYPKVKNIVSTIRGSRLEMTFKAEQGETWYQEFTKTVGDAKFLTELYKNGERIWTGYIKPDGIFESFVTDRWNIEIQAIDGLSYLKDQAFKKESIVNGEVVYANYTGNINEMEALKICLKKTQQSLKQWIVYDFHLVFQTAEEPLPPVIQEGRKPLEDTYINADRFINQDEKKSVWDCEKVLNSILVKYGAFIFQHEDRWHIVRAKSFYDGREEIAYKLYNAFGDVIETGTKNIKNILGSQINGYYPHHAGANQAITYDSALGGYKVVYEYGFLKSIFSNSNFNWPNRNIPCPGWYVPGVANVTRWEVFVDQNDTEFYRPYFKGSYSGNEIGSPVAVIYDNTNTQSQTVSVNTNLTIIFGCVVENMRKYNEHRAVAIVRIYGNDGSQWDYDDVNNVWAPSETNTEYTKVYYYPNSITLSPGNTYVSTDPVLDFQRRTFETTFNTPQTPVGGRIAVVVYGSQSWGVRASKPDGTAYEDIHSMQMTNCVIRASEENIKGESHTVVRDINTTNVIDDILTVTSGDNTSDLYIGGIETEDDINTVAWYKYDDVGVIITYGRQWLLQLLAYDRMRMSGGNSQIFSGGIFGYIPYLGLLSIDNVPGIFMIVEYNWDLKRDQIEYIAKRIFTEDNYIDLDYEFELEGDLIVKPTINS